MTTRGWMAIALAGTVACERSPTPVELTEEQVVVHGMLVAGESNVAILLVRAAPRSFYANRATVQPITGAAVTLRDGSTTIPLGFNPASPACVSTENGLGGVPDTTMAAACYHGSVPGGIRTGATYDLRVTLPDGHSIEGRTTVPSAPAIESPANGSTLEIAGPPTYQPGLVTLRWSGPTPLVQLNVRLARANCAVQLQEKGDIGGATGIDTRDRDGLAFRVLGPVCNPRDTTSVRFDAEILLTRFDANYARYYDELRRESGSIRNRFSAIGITGAAGVFGSAATARRPVVLRRQGS